VCHVTLVVNLLLKVFILWPSAHEIFSCTASENFFPKIQEFRYLQDFPILRGIPVRDSGARRRRRVFWLEVRSCVSYGAI
jgi:hypothetical protein